MNERLFFALVLIWLGMGWGSSQPLSKIATESGHGPFGLIFWQLVVCVIVLGSLCLARRKVLLYFTREAMAFYVVVAFLGTLIPNATFYISAARLPSGIMSILISTVPMLAFPLSLIAGIDRFSLVRLAGLALGLTGVAIIALSGGSTEGLVPAYLPLALVGPLFYALEATYVAKTGTRGMDAVQAMFGASLVGLIFCLPITLVLGQGFVPWPVGRPELALLLSSTMHGLLYATYVWLAARAGSVFAAQSSYLVTGSGVLWAMVLLGERFSPMVWLALVVMLAGVALVRPRNRATTA